MAFGDEDVAVRRDEHVVRLEEVLGVAPAARLAERHQQLAVGAELVDLMSLGVRPSAAPGRGRRPARVAPRPAPPRPRRRRACTRSRSTQTLFVLVDEDAMRRRGSARRRNASTSFPFASNLSTGSSVEPAQLFVPQRSATQMLLPSRSIVDRARRAPRRGLRAASPSPRWSDTGFGATVDRRHVRLRRRRWSRGSEERASRRINGSDGAIR